MSGSRNAALDWSRLLAIFGVVVFHAKAPGGSFGYSGLLFFVLLLGLFVVPMAARWTVAEFARDRARRLLLPWLVWSALYGAAKLLQTQIEGEPLSAEFAPWMFATGSALHLWFLPFAFVAGVALHALARSGVSPAGLGTAGIMLAVAGWALQAWTVLPIPLAQWVYVLPALGLGLCLSAGAVTWWPVTIAACLVAVWVGRDAGVLQLATALALLAACLHMSVRLPSMTGLADLTLTIYLAHPLVASLLERLTGIAPDSLAAASLTMAFSSVFALALGWLARSWKGWRSTTGQYIGADD